MKSIQILLTVLFLTFIHSQLLSFTPSGLLEIHTINVQQGTSVLVIGPDGTTILLDGGNNGKGSGEVVPYLESIGLQSVDGLDYMIASHLHADHLGGLDEVILEGYDVRKKIYDNGSDYWTQTVEEFKEASERTTAGSSEKIPLGTVIPLGDCAMATCVTADGEILGHGNVENALVNENDRSIGILIEYHQFQYLFAGDLGGGSDDSVCTGRKTLQVNVETPLVSSLLPEGGASLLGTLGIEVLHVNHHGSESSTNSDWMNLLTPQVALISVGDGQSLGWNHPRKAVVENVLSAGRYCISADSCLVLQTEEGSPIGNETSFAGFCVGDIFIQTEGHFSFRIVASGSVSQGPVEILGSGLPREFKMEEYSWGSTFLIQNTIQKIYPNPFSCSTTIRFQLFREDQISLKIYDLTGSLIKTLIDGEELAGLHDRLWVGENDDGEEVPMGVYLFHIQGKGFDESKRVTLLR